MWPCTHDVDNCLCQFSPERLTVTNNPTRSITTPNAQLHRTQAAWLLEHDMPEEALWHIEQAATLDILERRRRHMPTIPIGPVQVEHSPEAEHILAAALVAEALGNITWDGGQWV